MSFFIETSSSSDEKSGGQTVILFSTHKNNEPYKRYLSEMGGTFVRELEAHSGSATESAGKYPAWVFDISKKTEVEAFISENDDRESVQSLPDYDLCFDEIFRRLESIEKTFENIYEELDSLRSRKGR